MRSNSAVNFGNEWSARTIQRASIANNKSFGKQLKNFKSSKSIDRHRIATRSYRAKVDDLKFSDNWRYISNGTRKKK
jgi:hypothetical protein